MSSDQTKPDLGGFGDTDSKPQGGALGEQVGSVASFGLPDKGLCGSQKMNGGGGLVAMAQADPVVSFGEGEGQRTAVRGAVTKEGRFADLSDGANKGVSMCAEGEDVCVVGLVTEKGLGSFKGRVSSKSGEGREWRSGGCVRCVPSGLMALLMLYKCDASGKAAGVDNEDCGALEVIEWLLATVEESALGELELTGEAAPKGLEGGVSER